VHPFLEVNPRLASLRTGTRFKHLLFVLVSVPEVARGHTSGLDDFTGPVGLKRHQQDGVPRIHQSTSALGCGRALSRVNVASQEGARGILAAATLTTSIG